MKKLIVVLFAFLILFACFGLFVAKRSVPQKVGTLRLSNFIGKALVLTDSEGIPHIEADNSYDLYFTLGHVIASERLFQIDIMRRAAKGELAEILGKKLVDFDKRSRVFGFNHYSKKHIVNQEISKKFPRMWKSMSAFMDGINNFIENGPLPLEFYILNYKPRKFEISDSYAFVGYMGFGFSSATKLDPLFTQLAKKFPKEMLNDLLIYPLKDNVSTKNLVVKTLKSSLDKSYQTLAWIFTGYPALEGSNAWVLGPKKTLSGKVLLANDPHISFSNPGIWFEAHLKNNDQSDPFEIYGHFLPLIPFPALGHNKDYGWGLTMSLIDDMDLYREKLDIPVQKVMYEKEWVPLLKRNEIVKVRWSDDVDFEVQTTPHGPIVGPVLFDKTEDHAISAKWPFYLADNFAIRSIYLLGRSKDMKDFEEAVSLGASPGLNIIYGNQQGDIAWWVFGRIPNRNSKTNPQFILNGYSGEHEYDYYSFKDNPKLINPASGVIVSANYAPQGAKSNMYGQWQPEDRFKTISTLLKLKEKWGIHDTMELQTKSYNVEFEIVQEIYLNYLSKDKLENDIMLTQMFDFLKRWDFISNKDSTGATIFHQLYRETLNLIFDELSGDQLKVFCSFSSRWRSYKQLLRQPKSIWWDKVDTVERETIAEILLLAFNNTRDSLVTRFGRDMKSWKWGQQHTLEFPHPLGRVGGLFRILFNQGPFQAAGGYNQINNLQHTGCEVDNFSVMAGPSTRRVIDFDKAEESFGILPQGNSGHILSPFYYNQGSRFLDGKYRVQRMDLKPSEIKKLSVIGDNINE